MKKIIEICLNRLDREFKLNRGDKRHLYGYREAIQNIFWDLFKTHDLIVQSEKGWSAKNEVVKKISMDKIKIKR